MGQNAIEHGRGQSSVAGKRFIPLAEEQVRGEYDRAALVAFDNEDSTLC